MANNEEFYRLIKQDIEEEANDNEKYLKLAKMAPTEKARKILTDIAAEEKIHHRFLEEILKDAGMASNSAEESEEQKKLSASNKRLDANNEIDYPTHIENAGVDPDELMD